VRLAFAIPYAGGSHVFLARAIESVRAQDYSDWQLTILDDSRESADLGPLLATYADTRIRLRTNPGAHGIGAAWNACLGMTDAEFLTILHADDELEPDYASTMLALADEHPTAALLYCNVRVIDEASRPIASLRDGFKRILTPRGERIVLRGASAIERFCLGNFVLAPTILYRRDAIARRQFSTSYRFVLDLDFLVDTLLGGQVIVGTSQILLRYRRHASQETAILGRDTTRMDEEIAYYRGLAARMHASGRSRLRFFALLRLSTRLNGVVTALADLRYGRLRAASEKLVRSAIV
jgi:glycosyltransferase involved in cell wall biosynthesis